MDLKPRKLDLYIFKKFIFSFFIALALIMVIVIIFDISEKIDNFVANQAPLHAIIFDYYLNFIPYFINMFSPLFVFITVIFFTSRLAANSEIIAMLSSGISYHRLMVPYLVASLLIAGLSLYLNLFVIPVSNQTRIAFEQKYVKDKSEARRTVHYQIEPGTYVFVESFSTWNNTGYGFTLETVENNKLSSKLSAETAVWDSTMQGWRLKKCFLREYSSGLEDKITFINQIDTVISLTVNDFYRNKQTVQTIPYKQLNELIETQQMRGDKDVMYAQIEQAQRFALPFSAFILTIMGVSLSSRKKRGGIGWNIALGIGLAFTYILFLKFSQMFVFTGALSPNAALWLPNVVFTIITGVLYKLAPK